MPLFSNISGDQDLEQIDQRIEGIFSNIPKNELDKTSTEDLAGSVFDSLVDNADLDEVNKLFDNISIPYERIQRYGVYEELNRAVPIIKRIIRVYIANILQKNPVDGKCILLKPTTKDTDDQQKNKNQKKYVEKILKNYKLIHKLKTRILPLFLLYGDCFIETVQVEKEAKKIKVSDVLALNESKNILKEVEKIEKNLNKNVLESRLDSILNKLANLLIVEEDDVPTSSNIEDREKYEFINTLLRVHAPNCIIILENDYGTVLGYLHIQKYTTDYGSVNDISKVLSQTVGRVSSLSKYTTVDHNELINKLVAYMIKKVLKNQGSSDVDQQIDQVLKNLDDDAYQVFRRIIVEQGLDKKRKYQRLKIRFISPEDIVHFNIPSIDNYPYGESIVDPLVLPAKLYILSQLSNIIAKLSRAALVRKWTIDVGNTQMHAAQIQKLNNWLLYK